MSDKLQESIQERWFLMGMRQSAPPRPKSSNSKRSSSSSDSKCSSSKSSRQRESNDRSSSSKHRESGRRHTSREETTIHSRDTSRHSSSSSKSRDRPSSERKSSRNEKRYHEKSSSHTQQTNRLRKTRDKSAGNESVAKRPRIQSQKLPDANGKEHLSNMDHLKFLFTKLENRKAEHSPAVVEVEYGEDYESPPLVVSPALDSDFGGDDCSHDNMMISPSPNKSYLLPRLSQSKSHTKMKPIKHNAVTHELSTPTTTAHPFAEQNNEQSERPVVESQARVQVATEQTDKDRSATSGHQLSEENHLVLSSILLQGNHKSQDLMQILMVRKLGNTIHTPVDTILVNQFLDQQRGKKANPNLVLVAGPPSCGKRTAIQSYAARWFQVQEIRLDQVLRLAQNKVERRQPHWMSHFLLTMIRHNQLTMLAKKKLVMIPNIEDWFDWNEAEALHTFHHLSQTLTPDDPMVWFTCNRASTAPCRELKDSVMTLMFKRLDPDQCARVVHAMSPLRTTVQGLTIIASHMHCNLSSTIQTMRWLLKEKKDAVLTPTFVKQNESLLLALTREESGHQSIFDLTRSMLDKQRPMPREQVLHIVKQEGDLAGWMLHENMTKPFLESCSNSVSMLSQLAYMTQELSRAQTTTNMWSYDSRQDTLRHLAQQQVSLLYDGAKSDNPKTSYASWLTQRKQFNQERRDPRKRLDALDMFANKCSLQT